MILEQKFTILSANSDNTFYHALSKKDGKEVAIKKVSFGNMSPKDKKKLIDEVNILLSLKCSNIVKYYSYFVNREKVELFIIMEHCSGGALKQLLELKRKEGARLEEKAIWKIFSQVVLAVSEIHNDKSGAIIHRNIGPSSIFLDKDNNMKLGNFSFLKRLDPSQKFAETYLPNVSYLSPEQVSSGIFTQETDIWQLGCLLYEMACLKPPFRMSSDFVRAEKIRSSETQPIPSGYSSELHRVIKYCMNKELGKRPTIDTLVGIPEINYFIRQKRLSENRKWTEEKEKMLRKKELELDIMEEQIKRMEEQIEREQASFQFSNGLDLRGIKSQREEFEEKEKENIGANSNLYKNTYGYSGEYFGLKNNSTILKRSK